MSEELGNIMDLLDRSQTILSRLESPTDNGHVDRLGWLASMSLLKSLLDRLPTDDQSVFMWVEPMNPSLTAFVASLEAFENSGTAQFWNSMAGKAKTFFGAVPWGWLHAVANTDAIDVGKIKLRFNEAETKLTNLHQRFNQDLTDQSAQFRKDQDDKYTDLQVLLDKSAEALSKIEGRVARGADLDLTGNTAAEAKDANSRGKWLRFGSIVAAAAAVLAAVIATATASSDASIGRSLTVLGITAGLGGIAAYFARDAGLEFAEARQLRRISLELLVMDEFFAEMDDEKRLDRRSELAANYFVGGRTAPNKGEAAIPQNVVIELIRTASQTTKAASTKEVLGDG